MPPSLPVASQRLERLEETAEHFTAQLARRAVDAAALVHRHLRAQVLRQHLELHRVARHQAERLHVHDEPGRRSLGPALHHRLARQPVVRRVHLDGVEVLGVPREPLAGRQLRWIEVLRERFVRPGAGADPYVGQCETAFCRTDSFSVPRPSVTDDPAAHVRRIRVARCAERDGDLLPGGDEDGLVHQVDGRDAARARDLRSTLGGRARLPCDGDGCNEVVPALPLRVAHGDGSVSERLVRTAGETNAARRGRACLQLRRSRQPDGDRRRRRDRVEGRRRPVPRIMRKRQRGRRRADPVEIVDEPTHG